MLRRAGLLTAFAALLVPAVAGTTIASAKTRAPVVTRVTPKHVFVGETLTIKGHHFRRGMNKNMVAFKRDGAKAVFVRAAKSTTKMLQVTLPKRLEKVLLVKNGTPTPTRLRVRVLATKFGKRFSSAAKSPIVGPEKPPAPDAPEPVDPNGDCDGDHQLNKVDTDDDNDLLSDTLEKTVLKTDPCVADTDGDGVEDGYEYQSARDLNDDEYQDPQDYLPYPEKRPYPNALDGTDANTDHDGDSLTLLDEYKLWKYTIANGATRKLTPLTYSAGEQYSLSTRGGDGHRVPTMSAAAYATYPNKQWKFLNWASTPSTSHPYGYQDVSLVDLGALDLGTLPQSAFMPDAFGPRILRDIRDMDRSGGLSGAETAYYDFHRNGWLDDGERDEDADGLPNQWESTGCMKREVWDGLYDKESPYYLKYAGVRLDDEDTDGDGVRDGADDQDHDDVPNIMECSRSLAYSNAAIDPKDFLPPNPPWRLWRAFVNPFNPCLPHPKSRTCKQFVEVGTDGNAWAPYNEDEYGEYYLIKN
jgi:IPT/TIG domain-containing protein